jgi:GSH-dependent disulfide-bond oxidoreductase
MIDFYYWPTPNGWKVSIMLEECGLEYRTVPVNIGKGDQFKPEFLAISPNNRMPAIVDHDDPDGPVSVFESGAILLHLAERSGRFMPAGRKGRKEVMEWLFWQVGNLGPMAGQLSHFVNYAEGQHPYCTSATPTNTTAASASWSAGWRDGNSSSANIRSPTCAAGRGC